MRGPPFRRSAGTRRWFVLRPAAGNAPRLSGAQRPQRGAMRVVRPQIMHARPSITGATRSSEHGTRPHLDRRPRAGARTRVGDPSRSGRRHPRPGAPWHVRRVGRVGVDDGTRTTSRARAECARRRVRLRRGVARVGGRRARAPVDRGVRRARHGDRPDAGPRPGQAEHPADRRRRPSAILRRGRRGARHDVDRDRGRRRPPRTPVAGHRRARRGPAARRGAGDDPRSAPEPPCSGATTRAGTGRVRGSTRRVTGGEHHTVGCARARRSRPGPAAGVHARRPAPRPGSTCGSRKLV